MPDKPATSMKGYFNEPWREGFGLERPMGAKTEYIYGFGKTEECLSRLFEWSERTRWIIELEKAHGQTEEDFPQLATIRLLPGVSLKEARKAAEIAVRRLGKQGVGRRPSTPSTVITVLHKLFEAVEPEINQRGIRKNVIEICDVALRYGGKPISRSRIQNELLRWLRQRKHRIKRYER
ncbi:MAG: hypothetical protein P0121_00855 [Nitrospira sp.]|nr:hypothetical protein [Nitrospira sp.]